MPRRKRCKTNYPGVYYVLIGKQRVYYIAYRKKGESRLIEEQAYIPGKGMTPSLASQLRSERIKGKAPTNKEKRQSEREAKKADEDKVTISKLWDLYRENLEGLKSKPADSSRFNNYLKPTFGDKEPQEIIPLDIDRLCRKRLADKSDQTIKHVLALLRRIVRYGIKKRITQGLTFNLDMPSVDNEVTEELNKEQVAR
ncbi:MAG: integrase, partial [Deltaproteobacteria bacterium]|nr:integrase [Deltaproteobacteria bacterium]